MSRSALPKLQRELEALRARAERYRDPALAFQLGRAVEAIAQLGATYRTARQTIVSAQVTAREEIKALTDLVQERESAAAKVPRLRALPAGGGRR